MDSEIQKFYRNKTVFITGGSGFLGKVIIEKLLRTTTVSRIYMMIRTKRGKSMEERFESWRKDSIFETLLSSRPDALDILTPIAGDCQEMGLGISDANLQLLKAEVQIVLHGAATVRFNEPLHVALAINTRGTHLMLQLAKEMRQLVAFVHISTAFSNCMTCTIDEEFHPEELNCNSEKVLQLSEQISEELLDKLAPALSAKFPNTYTYSKALAEDVVLREAGNLPICIFRPGVIIATAKEPVSGWIDNLYGPIAITYGVAYGVLRLALLDTKAHCPTVPVDFCANVALSSAWKVVKESRPTIEEQCQKPPTIYNYASSPDNVLTYGDFRDLAMIHGAKYPVTKMLWYPFLHCISTIWLFPLAAFFYHTLPGHLVDLGLRVMGKKPRLVKAYEKIHKNIKALGPFALKTWDFEMNNLNQLWRDMSPEDQKIYNFDIQKLDWNEYFNHALRGMRLYLGKETPTEDSYDVGRKLLKRFYVLHVFLQFLLCFAAGSLIWFLFGYLASFL
ncbi:fatty acyl-CoA reductase wat-like [Drosophila tropicalis]|uniref:fatty acyl-CoA reductase wat-like n=1 Tax=Drosophila tropicalis TaxID=46794 RepID=UPI0035AC08B0